MGDGAAHYGPRNWRGLAGAPREAAVLDCFQHAVAHLMAWADGDRTEDHLGHALANVAIMADCGA